MTELTATNLKNSLWDTLQAVKDGSMQPHQGDAVASMAREITRTVKIQLEIARNSKRSVPLSVINFSENDK